MFFIYLTMKHTWVRYQVPSYSLYIACYKYISAWLPCLLSWSQNTPKWKLFCLCNLYVCCIRIYLYNVSSLVCFSWALGINASAAIGWLCFTGLTSATCYSNFYLLSQITRGLSRRIRKSVAHVPTLLSFPFPQLIAMSRSRHNGLTRIHIWDLVSNFWHR